MIVPEGTMLLPDEVAAKSVIPALRAMVAKRLVGRHGLTQQEVADRLDITQAAVSNYVRKSRGMALNLDGIGEVEEATGKIASMLVKGSVNPIIIMTKFEEVSRLVKNKRLMCDFHVKLEPSLDANSCDACISPIPKSLVQISKKN